MAVAGDTIRLERTTELQMIDITREVAAAVSRSGLRDGIVVVFNVGSTGALTTIEFGPGLQQKKELINQFAEKECDLVAYSKNLSCALLVLR